MKDDKETISLKREVRTYTDEQKIEALIVLNRNHGQLVKTANELGIPYKSLTYWRDNMQLIDQGKSTKNKEYIASLVKLRSNKVEVAKMQDASYLEIAAEIREKGLMKVSDLLDLCNSKEDLHAVAGAYKIVVDSINNTNQVKTPIDPQGNILYQQINNIIQGNTD